MNTELLQKVVDHIEANPHTFIQADWTRYGKHTKHCIGGWTVLLSEQGYCLDTSPLMLGFVDPNFKTKSGEIKKQSVDAKQIAEKLLGINQKQGDILFTGSPKDDWPKPFSEQWSESFLKGNTYEDVCSLHAKVAVDFIKFLITNGVNGFSQKKVKQK
jgi:hypothetical protein